MKGGLANNVCCHHYSVITFDFIGWLIVRFVELSQQSQQKVRQTKNRQIL